MTYDYDQPTAEDQLAEYWATKAEDSRDPAVQRTLAEVKQALASQAVEGLDQGGKDALDEWANNTPGWTWADAFRQAERLRGGSAPSAPRPAQPNTGPDLTRKSSGSWGGPVTPERFRSMSQAEKEALTPEQRDALSAEYARRVGGFGKRR